MSLHHSKREAILQWYNSFSSYDLSDISQLSDGKYFCGIIHSVFKRRPKFLFEATTSKQGSSITIDMSPVIHSIEDELKYIQNEKIDTQKLHTLSTNSIDKSVFKEVPNNEYMDVETVNIPSDSLITTESIEDDSSSESTKSYNSGFKNDKLVDDVTAPPTIMITTNIETESFVNDLEEFNVDVEKVYEFIKEIIDEYYNIKSETIIAYDLCPKKDELELGKVAVLILVKVIEQFIGVKNEALNTLYLLDQNVQEDIRQCLSVLLEQKKVSKRDLTRLLSKAAKYKPSPRKSPRSAVTPSRNRSHSRNSLILGTSTDEVYTDSPLKSFLDSPQLKRVLASKNKELQKVQKNLLVEELKTEDLKDEIVSLKKKLEEKDKEIFSLKRELRELSLKDENVECKTCIEYKSQLEFANQRCKELQDEYKEKDIIHEEDCTRLSSKIRDLELTIKTNETKAVINAFDHLPQLVMEKEEHICHLTSVCERLAEYCKMVHIELTYVLNAQARIMALEEPELAAIANGLPGDGECLGNVIEAENKILRQRLEFIIQNLYNILVKCGISEQFAVDLKQNLNIPNKHMLMEPSNILPKDININFMSRKKFTDQSDEDEVYEILDLVQTSQDIASVIHPPVNERRASLRSRNTKSVSTCSEKSFSNSDSVAISAKATSSKLDFISYPNFGSFWDQRQPSKNNNNYCEESVLCDISNFTKSKLRAALGFSDSDYSAKIETVKKLLNNVKDLFKPNGTNGRALNFHDTNFNFKTEEDYLRCLLYIKESLLTFQTVTSSSKNCLKRKCCDEAIEISRNEILDLKDENCHLKEQLRNSETLKHKIEQKDNKLLELRKQITSLKLEFKELSKLNEDLHAENEELSKNLSIYKQETEKMILTIQENAHYKSMYIALKSEKDQNEKRFREKLMTCKHEMISLHNKKKTYFAAYEKEKQQKKEIAAQFENIRNEIVTSRAQKKIAEKLYNDIKLEKQKLEAHIKELQKKQSQPQVINPRRSIAVTSNTAIQSNVNTDSVKIDVQNPFNLKLQLSTGAPSIPTSISDSNFTGYTIPVELNNESITSLGNRHNGSFLPCPSDEPHCYFNLSSIAEKKPIVSIAETEEANTSLYNKIKHRNSLCPPHLRQSFAVNCSKLVTSSPIMAPREQVKNQNAQDVKSQKRMKLLEDVAGPSGLSTPDLKSKKFKTPSSLRKLMMYKRKHPA